jgi:hypothetical protein
VGFEKREKMTLLFILMDLNGSGQIRAILDVLQAFSHKVFPMPNFFGVVTKQARFFAIPPFRF